MNRTLRRFIRRLRTPFRLRALIRSDELAYTALAAVIGALAGLSVVVLEKIISLMTTWLFAFSGHGVSGADDLEPIRIFMGPVAGGILLGISYLVGRKYFPRISDPIEANALKGGRMRGRSSLFIVIQTIISSGFGASVGMEAAYTQAGGSLGSKLGQKLRLRRDDLRQILASGAGAAIAAAFNAPLAGAFYAFELVLASYSVASLLPVLAATIAAVGVAQLLRAQPSLDFYFSSSIDPSVYLPIAVLAVISALAGILIMRGVTWIERAFAKSRIPGVFHPVIGGIAVGGMALISPMVLSSGHGAVAEIFTNYYSPWILLLVFVLKSAASAVSIGSGFRGGLFFASIMLGVVLGKLFGFAWLQAFDQEIPIVLLSVVGMCALATAIIGAPLTMVFLALETTSSLPLTLAVLFSALIATVIVRRLFGFSFATWRFHLRGEIIRSAADIGWLRELSVGKLMRRNTAQLLDTTSIGKAKRKFPIGSTKSVLLIDENNHYAGMLSVADLYNYSDLDHPVSNLASLKNACLVPEMNVRDAITQFTRTESDILPVLKSRSSPEILGTLSEQHCLRRYTEEMNKRLYPRK